MNEPPDIFKTVVVPAASIDSPASDDGNAKIQDGVRLAAESAPALRDETAETLRGRLLVVASVLCFGLSLFLVRGFLLGDAVMQAIRIGVFLVTVGCIVATRPTSQLSLRPLRVVELLVFGSVAVQLICFQVTQTLSAVAASRSEAIAAATMFCFMTWVFLIMMYGMFIPNSWKRALRFIIPATAAPTGLTLILESFYDGVLNAVGVGPLIAATLMAIVSAVCSLCGTQIVNSLRREVFEARQYGQYRLSKKLGAGGMGEVYLAEHRLLKRPSAIKLIHASQVARPEAIERFESEVQATATLSHWNTVEIFDYGRADDGTFYYVMEYLPGMDLEQIVTRFGPMPPPRAIHFIKQVCDALEEAHGIGLIHRDVKPANVFAAQRGGNHDVAKLVDFGIATQMKLHDNRQQGLTIEGSPLYMSPEQAWSPGTVDGRSDIYSLGITAYFLLTGRHPFEGSSPLSVVQAHLNNPVPPPSKYVALPADIEAIVMRCVKKDAADRFQGVAELRDALATIPENDWTQREAANWWNDRAASVSQ